MHYWIQNPQNTSYTKHKDNMLAEYIFAEHMLAEHMFAKHTINGYIFEREKVPHI